MDDILTLYLQQKKEIYEEFSKLSGQEAVLLPDGLLLSSPGAKANGGWVLAKGLAKQYRHGPEGKAIVSGFWHSPDVIIQHSILLDDRVPADYIRLAEDSELRYFTLTEPETPILKYHYIRQILYASLLRLPAKEALRYLKLLYPLTRIQRKDLASFLGITPSTLSRLL